ncbi:sulfur carrier protein [Collimonas sp. PA-H2]|uniref:sulfur carrier protein ThiS n=1 Tax=Collimonas sp. PA-H2 TaxID=1881062 RepID=UPI000BF76F55|nr:sulfur carrier protein ThiS [Collimonas sp. PA-H2]PFH10594.1 sulfur carrier protein [Collimonas sp. PA-H2]
MEIVLNGAPHPLTDGESLQQLIAALELAGKAVAVAVNRQVVPASLWPQRILQAADKVDIVRAIGGG